MSCAGDILFL